MERTCSLFEPLAPGGITLANRMAVSRMCQYSAAKDWPNTWARYRYLVPGLSSSSRRRSNRRATSVSAVSASIPMQTARRWPALSASAGEQVRRRSAFSLPMPAARVREFAVGRRRAASPGRAYLDDSSTFRHPVRQSLAGPSRPRLADAERRARHSPNWPAATVWEKARFRDTRRSKLGRPGEGRRMR